MARPNFSDRDQQLIDVAIGLWARYGLGKTTMAEIAAAAGVARQTLYNAYPNKEALLRAAVHWYFWRTLDALEEAWAKATSLGAKIDVFFQHVPLEWYDRARAGPHGAELMDGAHGVAQEAMAEMDARMVAALTGVFENAPDPAGVADFFYSTAVTAKKAAQDRHVLVQRLSILKASVLALVESS